jgi:hypothetical protein
LRSKLPWLLVNRGIAAKGKRDCGGHDWYNHDNVTALCYHCEVGTRPFEPKPAGPLPGELSGEGTAVD